MSGFLNRGFTISTLATIHNPWSAAKHCVTPICSNSLYRDSCLKGLQHAASLLENLPNQMKKQINKARLVPIQFGVVVGGRLIWRTRTDSPFLHVKSVGWPWVSHS